MAYCVRSIAVLLCFGPVIAACSQTTRVGEDASAGQLAKAGKAVVVVRLGQASPACKHVGMWLGRREGLGYRPVKPVAVMHVASLNDVPVAEVELDPGEYHVISYACGTGSAVDQVASYDSTTGLARTSYASFSVAAGEVVNVGSFEFYAARSGRNAFGRPIRATVSVTDWPLSDLERYKAKRPHIYSQMRTRLMVVAQPASEEAVQQDCDRLRQLKADGKVQALPVACYDRASAVKATAKAR